MAGLVIEAVVFDFDGTVMDTETMEFEAWAGVFRDHGVNLDLGDWVKCVGTTSDAFDVYAHLETLVGKPIDKGAVRECFHRRFSGAVSGLGALPGVVGWFNDARSMGIGLGVASCSRREKLIGHLLRLGLWGHVGALAGLEDVSRPKPDPDAYLTACSMLGVDPRRALAVEDSPNGARAALAAGLTCVVVPNPVTKGLEFPRAHLFLDSLGDASLGDVLHALGFEPVRVS